MAGYNDVVIESTILCFRNNRKLSKLTLTQAPPQVKAHVVSDSENVTPDELLEIIRYGYNVTISDNKLDVGYQEWVDAQDMTGLSNNDEENDYSGTHSFGYVARFER
jgi:hypothetical protein